MTTSKVGKLVFRTTVLLLLVTFVAGCKSSGIPSPELMQETAQMQARELEQTPQEMVDSARKSIINAKEAELDFYAPSFFSMAEEYLANAEEYLAEGAKQRKILTEVMKLEKTLDSANIIKGTVATQLAPIIEEKKYLDYLKAGNVFEEEYTRLLDEAKELIAYIEDDNLEKAMALQPEIHQLFRSLVVKTVKTITLKPTTIIIANAKEIGAHKYAPQTFKHAEGVIQRTLLFIETTPKDEDRIKELGVEALKAAQHTLYVCEEINRLDDLSTKDMESYVLSFETNLHNINSATGSEDIRFMPLKKQSNQIAATVKDLKRKSGGFDSLEKEIADLKASVEKYKTDAAAASEELEAFKALSSNTADQIKELEMKLTAATRLLDETNDPAYLQTNEDGVLYLEVAGEKEEEKAEEPVTETEFKEPETVIAEPAKKRDRRSKTSFPGKS
jgi:outer membrane murein-binding lipoprotein Lpp